MIKGKKERKVKRADVEQPHIALPIFSRLAPRATSPSTRSFLLRFLLLLLLSLLRVGHQLNPEVAGSLRHRFTSRAKIGTTLFDSFLTKAKWQLGLLCHAT